MPNCFLPAEILLPAPGVPLDPWACIAVDQFTSQPEYWRKAEDLARGKPSTLHIVLPEAYLGTEQEETRLHGIRAAMAAYRQNVLTRTVRGYVYVERTQLCARRETGHPAQRDHRALAYPAARAHPPRRAA